MFLTQQAIAAHPRLMGHFQELQANRNIWNNQNALCSPSTAAP